jgi:DEAD/DEAH box helicase domain-containing protein
VSVSDVLRELREDTSLAECITSWRHFPARGGRTSPWPPGLDPRLVAAAAQSGIERPYTHQAQATEAALGGEHVVLSTSTASGKTLAYNLPVLNTLLSDADACALYLYPTKALAYDQVEHLGRLIGALGAEPCPGGRGIPVRPYDGDTPAAHRSAFRREARVLVTNPDMLHTGILPHHTRWIRFLSNLRYVVLDELHTYRGVFGGHVSNVLRRLKRVCSFYGASPLFLCASATIANPRGLAERLIESRVHLVDDDGAPRGEKHVVLVNPPIVDRALGIRRSSSLVATDIASRFLRAGVQTIVFARSRLTTEVLLGYLREAVGDGSARDGVQGYRGGYLPDHRRQIEGGLRSGQVRAVVATNALELGIDIGQLDACVITGYPGTVASTWQQAGRAGRRTGVSAAVLVASALPLDQYLVTHPEYLFGRPIEHALIDPDNPVVLSQHLACASFELPFESFESFGSVEDPGSLLEVLVEEGQVHHSKGRYVWIGDGYPAAQLSLRTNSPDNIVIQAVGVDSVRAGGPEQPRVIGYVDHASAPELLHNGAVYLHAGEAFLVESLDLESGVARVVAADLDYYTRSSSSKEVRVDEDSSYRDRRVRGRKGDTTRGFGRTMVTSRVTGYKKIRYHTHEVLAWAPLELPEQQLQTTGYWMSLSEGLTDSLVNEGVLQAEIDYGPNWPAQRDNARSRDGYRCRRCGTPERDGRHHDVHHITPFRSFGYVVGANDLYRAANQLENLITLCPSCHRLAERARGARGALSGLGYMLHNLAPLHLMCDPSDLGVAVASRDTRTGQPTVTVYDRAPGGAGLAARLFEVDDEVLRACAEVVWECGCTDGCPACVGPGGDNPPGTKRLTAMLLQALMRES